LRFCRVGVIVTLMPVPREVDGVYKIVGRRFREVRTSKGITQADVATETGLSRQSVANIELGRQRFMLHTLFDVARALGVSPVELLPSAEGSDMTLDLEKVELSPTARRFAQSILQSKSTRS
jgi:transcriptional regulator with XRE-family HTH domain